MLGVVLFIAFWVIVGVIIFLIAARGGRGTAVRRRMPAGRTGTGMVLAFVVIYIGFGAVIPLLFLHGNNANASKQVGGIRLTPEQKAGRELFAGSCGQCHTLAAANAVGKVGPNLDNLRPPEPLVLNTIRNGCLQNPPPGSPQACLGYGNMPAGVLLGRQASQVADFVAAVAGRE